MTEKPILAKERDVICRCVVEILKAWSRAYDGTDEIGDKATGLIVGAAIMIGQASDKPMTASKIADYTGIPRATSAAILASVSTSRPPVPVAVR